MPAARAYSLKFFRGRPLGGGRFAGVGSCFFGDASGTGSFIRWPQALHFSVLAVGGIFCDGILCFLLQLLQVRTRTPADRAGCAAVFVGGVAPSALEASFFKECTRSVPVISSNFNATGRPQDLDVFAFYRGGSRRYLVPAQGMLLPAVYARSVENNLVS